MTRRWAVRGRVARPGDGPTTRTPQTRVNYTKYLAHRDTATTLLSSLILGALLAAFWGFIIYLAIT